MTDRGKITLIYSSVAVISAIILAFTIFLGSRVPEQEQPVYSDVGAEKAETFFPIQADLTGVNQAGEQVKLSDLKGKVWIVAEFFAVCPHCAVRNGQELKSIYDEFKDHPDFQVVCISVDPTTDTPERLVDYSEALGADPSNWWFMSHPDEKETHEYLEKELRFFGIRERTDPMDAEANGRFAHDMGIMLVDREWNVIGKWPLADARSEEGRKQDPQLYEKLKQQLYDRVEAELEKNETPGI
ncbi:SCO family protein [Luteolibacter marinus]|uniref:SCO family protein n=1 Tax=Luteolibacter marinus TaxID=2776705 RepID=UPI0018672EE5|nr:SCO family protein [Luteolibacter marinus]